MITYSFQSTSVATSDFERYALPSFFLTARLAGMVSSLSSSSCASLEGTTSSYCDRMSSKSPAEILSKAYWLPIAAWTLVCSCANTVRYTMCVADEMSYSNALYVRSYVDRCLVASPSTIREGRVKPADHRGARQLKLNFGWTRLARSDMLHSHSTFAALRHPIANIPRPPHFVYSLRNSAVPQAAAWSSPGGDCRKTFAHMHIQ